MLNNLTQKFYFSEWSMTSLIICVHLFHGRGPQLVSGPFLFFLSFAELWRGKGRTRYFALLLSRKTFVVGPASWPGTPAPANLIPPKWTKNKSIQTPPCCLLPLEVPSRRSFSAILSLHWRPVDPSALFSLGLAGAFLGSFSFAGGSTADPDEARESGGFHSHSCCQDPQERKQIARFS